MSRVGLGRHGQLDSDVGDPLDGLVNMFDLGLVLAVAFLVAGLSLASKDAHRNAPKTPTTEQKLATPATHQTAAGQGRAVGQVYELPNGQLVLVKPGGGPPAP